MSHKAIKDTETNKWHIVDCKGDTMESTPTFDSIIDALKYINLNFLAKKVTGK